MRSRPLIVTMRSLELYPTTVSYWYVSKTPVENRWLTSHSEAMTDEECGAGTLSEVYFTPAHWKIAIDATIHALHGFVTHDRAHQSMRVTQGCCKSAADCRECMEPCFAQLKKHLLVEWAVFHSTTSPKTKTFSSTLEIFLRTFVEQISWSRFQALPFWLIRFAGAGYQMAIPECRGIHEILKI